MTSGVNRLKALWNWPEPDKLKVLEEDVRDPAVAQRLVQFGVRQGLLTIPGRAPEQCAKILLFGEHLSLR